MTNDEALQYVKVFRQRLERIASMGGDPPWETEWEILKNDIEEFVAEVFEPQGKDHEIVDGALHHRVAMTSYTAWEFFQNHYLDKTDKALQLLQHRLEAGQARLQEPSQHERLVPADAPHSAYLLLREIVEGATRQVWIVDPYLDRSLLALLSNVPPSAEIRVLTRQQNLPADFGTELGLFTKQRGAPVEVRLGLNEFHDRFVVADDRVFFSGASFKDLGKKKGSVVMEARDIRDRVLSHLDEMWNLAKPI